MSIVDGKCDKCESTDIQRDTSYKYHDIFKCRTCGDWTFKRIEECCRNPYPVVAQDHKFPIQTRLYFQCLHCKGCITRNKPLSFAKHGNDCKGEFLNDEFENWKKERNEEGKQLAENKKQYNLLNSNYYKYKQYLLSNEWKEKRKLVLEKYDNLCQSCKEKRAEDVHHLTYDNLLTNHWII